MRLGRFQLGVALLALLVAVPLGSSARADDSVIALTIKDHRFEPAEVQIPAGVKVKILVHNADATPEEFESHSLNREKVVTAGGNITVFVGPLDPGIYEFFGDFHHETAQGHITVK